MIGLRIITYALTLGSILLCVISIALSLILFLNIGEDPLSKMIWGGVAIGFEFIKFALIPAGFYFYSRKKLKSVASIAVPFVLLMSLSISASIGSLAKNTQAQTTPYLQAVEKKRRILNEIDSLNQSVANRQKAIDVYIDERMISNKVRPLQVEIDDILLEVKALNEEVENMIMPPRSALSESIDSIAVLFGYEEEKTKSIIFFTFSFLLDFFAALSLLISQSLGLMITRSNKEERDLESKHNRIAMELARDHELRMKSMELEKDRFLAARDRSEKGDILPTSAPNISPVRPREVVDSAAPNSDVNQVKQAISQSILENPPSVRSIVKTLGMTPARAEKVVQLLVVNK